jgi:nicotinamide phosphoribosyltransferase
VLHKNFSSHTPAIKELLMHYNRTPFEYTDSYKLSHWLQYPEGTSMVYSNFTPRKSRTGRDEFVFFGLQAFLMKLNKVFSTEFFQYGEDLAVVTFEEFYRRFFCGADPSALSAKVRELHKIGHPKTHRRRDTKVATSSITRH